MMNKIVLNLFSNKHKVVQSVMILNSNLATRLGQQQ